MLPLCSQLKADIIRSKATRNFAFCILNFEFIPPSPSATLPPFPPETHTPLSALQTFPLTGESPKGRAKISYLPLMSRHLPLPLGEVDLP